ncbi:putative F-box/LRR-repeat protein 8-like protein, partial [Corchorus capsularis]
MVSLLSLTIALLISLNSPLLLVGLAAKLLSLFSSIALLLNFSLKRLRKLDTHNTTFDLHNDKHKLERLC